MLFLLRVSSMAPRLLSRFKSLFSPFCSLFCALPFCLPYSLFLFKLAFWRLFTNFDFIFFWYSWWRSVLPIPFQWVNKIQIPFKINKTLENILQSDLVSVRTQFFLSILRYFVLRYAFNTLVSKASVVLQQQSTASVGSIPACYSIYI